MAGTPASSRTAAGNFTLIEDLLLTVAAASFDFQSIPQGYKHLHIIVQDRSNVAATKQHDRLMRFNNDSGANYDQIDDNLGAAAGFSAAQTAMRAGQTVGAGSTANYSSLCVIWIPNYAETTFEKRATAANLFEATAAGADSGQLVGAGAWHNTAAVSRVTILPSSGNFVAGSRATLYGLS